MLLHAGRGLAAARLASDCRHAFARIVAADDIPVARVPRVPKLPVPTSGKMADGRRCTPGAAARPDRRLIIVREIQTVCSWFPLRRDGAFLFW